MLTEFIEQLSNDFAFEKPLAANKNGSYSLSFEPDIAVSLQEIPEGGIFMRTSLAILPEQRREEFMNHLLMANLFGKETGKSFLGLDEEAKNIVLSAFSPPSTTFQDFYSLLEDFVNYAEMWKQEILDFIKEAKGTEI